MIEKPRIRLTRAADNIPGWRSFNRWLCLDSTDRVSYGAADSTPMAAYRRWLLRAAA